MSRSLGTLTLDLIAKTGGFEQGMTRAQRKTKELDNDFKVMVARLDKAALALGTFAAGAAAGMVALTMQTVKTMDATSKMADQIGVTTESLTGLRFAAQQFANVSDQTFDMALRRMTRRIEEAAQGSGGAKAAFEAMGLSAKALARLSADQQFMRIADAMQKTDTQAQKLKNTMAIFDTEGMPLVNALAQGSEELEKNIELATKYGVVLSTQAARSAEQLTTNLSRLSSIQDGWRQQLTTAMLPALERMSGYMLGVAESALKVGDSRQQIEEFSRAAVEFVDDLARSYAGLVAMGRGVLEMLAELDGAALLWLEPFKAQTQSATTILTQSFSESILNTAREIDKLIGFAGGVMAVWEAVGDNIPAYFSLAWSAVLRGAAEFVNSLADIVNPALQTLGLDGFGVVEWGADAAVGIRDLAAAYAEGSRAALGAAGMADRVADAFSGVAAASAAASGVGPGASPGGGGGVAGLSKATQSLIDKLLPARTALTQLHRNLGLLQQAQKAGALTAYEYDQALLRLNATYTKAYKEALPEHIRKLDEQLEKLREQDQTIQRAVQVFGLADSAVMRLAESETRAALAKAESTRATEIANGASAERIRVLDEEIERLRQIAEMQGRVADGQVQQERLEATKKANDEILADWNRITGQIEQSLTDAIFGGSKSGRDLMMDLFKNIVLRVAVQPVVSSLMGGLGGLLGVPGASAPGGGLLGSLLGGGTGSSATGLLGMASTARTAYNALTGGITNQLASGVNWLGQQFGSSALQSFAAGMSGATNALGISTLGASLGGTLGTGAGFIGTGPAYAISGGAGVATGGAASSLGANVAAAVPVVGWILAGMSLADTLFGRGYDIQKTEFNAVGKALAGPTIIGDRILRGLGLSDRVANIFSGGAPIAALHTALFGGKQSIVRSGVQGRFDSGAGHTVVEDFDDWKKSGGLFGSSDRGTLRYYNESLTMDLRDIIQTSFDFVRAYADEIGLYSEGLSGHKRDFRFSGDDAGQQLQDALTEFLNDVVTWEMGWFLDPLRKEGEALGDTLVRLVETLPAVNSVLEGLGVQLFGMTTSGAENAAHFLDLFGGSMENLAAASSRWYELFYSDAEKLERATEVLRQEFGALGYSIPESREQLREWVEAQDLTTWHGRHLFTSLMGLGEAFVAVEEASTALYGSEMQRAEEEARQRLELWASVESAYIDIVDPAGKFLRIQQQISDQFAELGHMLPSDIEQYRRLVDLTGQLGELHEDEHLALMQLAPDFRSYIDALDEQGRAAREARDAIEQSARAWRGMQDATKGTIMSGASGLRERILLDQLGSDESRYAYFKSQADSLSGLINQTTDLKMLEDIFGRFISVSGSAYGLLDEDQRRDMNSEFQAAINDAEVRALQQAENAQQVQTEAVADATYRAVDKHMKIIVENFVLAMTKASGEFGEAGREMAYEVTRQMAAAGYGIKREASFAEIDGV